MYEGTRSLQVIGLHRRVDRPRAVAQQGAQGFFEGSVGDAFQRQLGQ